MKKLLPILACCATTSLFAQTTWIFDTNKYTQNFVTSTTTGEGENAVTTYKSNAIDWTKALSDGYFYTADGQISSSSTVIGKTDTLSIGNATYDQQLKINFNVASLEVKEIKFDGTKDISFSGSSNTNKLTATNITSSQASGQLTLNKLNLTVSDTLQAANSFAYMQDMSAVDIGTLTALSKIRYYVSSAGNETTSITNPSVKIGKILIGDGFYFTNIGTSRDLHYSIGNTDVPLCMNQTSGKDTITTTIVLTPQDTSKAYYTMYGLRSERAWVGIYTPLKIVMNGAAGAIQNINAGTTANAQYSTGDIQVISGQLYINFDQRGAAYTYTDNNNESPETAGKVVSYHAADGSRTSYSHGDLEMSGADGVFGSYHKNDNEGFGAFRFTNLVYEAGKIKLKLKNATTYDSIDLTSYSKYINGTEANDYADGTKVADYTGGTVMFGKNAADNAQVSFDLGDYAALSWLIDNEDGKYTLGDGLKIIAWDVANKTALESSDFHADNIKNGDDEFKAEFTVAGDGLYVKYVAVPEPSTYAAIFGALALGFAIYRRRK